MTNISEIEAIRRDYAEEEAEAAEAEVTDQGGLLDVTLGLRISRAQDAALRQRAAQERIPVSTLVRRLLARGLADTQAPITPEAVEAIARRVIHEELAARRA